MNFFLLIILPPMVVVAAGAVAVWAHGKALDRSAARDRQKRPTQVAE